MHKLLFHTFVAPFYRLNAGFFLFLFFFFFGIVRGGLDGAKDAQLLSYHHTIMLSLVHSPIFMAVVAFFWLLYFGKCVRFVLQTIQAPENTFLVNLQALQQSRQFLLLLPSVLLLYLPVLAYAFPVLILAITEAQVTTAGFLLLYLSACILAGVWLAQQSLQHYNKSFAWKALSTIRFGGNSLLSLQIAHLLTERKLALLSVKLMSLLVLYGIWHVNERFDETLFLMFFPIPVVAQAVLVYYVVRFTEKEMAFHRNLPLSMPRVFVAYSCTFLLLMLPEFAFILMRTAAYLSLYQTFSLYVLAVAVLLLFTAALYTYRAHQNKYTFAVLLLYFLLTYLMVLPQRLLLAGFILAVAAFLFQRSYRRFELT